MNIRIISLLFLSGIMLFAFSACSGNAEIDPVRPIASLNTPAGEDCIILSSSTSDVDILIGELSHPLEFRWSDDGLSATNNGEAVYDLILKNETESFSFGIVENHMTTAPLDIAGQDGSIRFEIEYKTAPYIEINGHITHSDGFDFDHAVILDEYDGYVDNEILFGFVDGTSDSERYRVIREHNLFLTGVNTTIGMHVARIDDSRTPFELIDELTKEESVKWPGVNGLMRTASWPSDYVWHDEWPDDYRWAMQRIQAHEAWDVYKDDILDNAGDARVTDIVMCIADTGVHPHVDFALEGFRYWTALDYSKNFDSPFVIPLDNYGHGTAVAGIAGASGDNEIGLAGVCWDPIFLSLKCLSDYGYGSYEAIGNSIAYIGDLAEIAPWMKFIGNYSLGGWGDDPWIRQAAQSADAYENTLLVAAAGNSGGDYADFFQPSSLTEFMSIGASSIFTEDDKCKEVYNECPRGWGSNWGTVVDVCAPGSMYVTTTNIPWNIMYDNPDPECPFVCDGWYCPHFGGTSAASPHVSGLAALLWSKYPDWTKAEVKQRIKDTTDEMSIPVEKEGKLGTGRINCYRALTDPF